MNADDIRILHLHFGKEGGRERFLVNLSGALSTRGVKQYFIIRPGRSWETDVSKLGPVLLNNNRQLTPSGWFLHWKLRRIIRDWQPTAIMAWANRAARLIPKIDIPLKFVRLGDYPWHIKHYGNCDFVLGNVPGIEPRLRDLGWTRPVVTITNFPSEQVVVPAKRADLDTPEDAFLIASAGRFVQRKGFDSLIRVVAEIPNAWLWLVGDGELRVELVKLVSKIGIAERTRFIGWNRDPMNYIAASNVFVMPSRHEPLGNVVLEAWRTGIPVVATRCEGPSWFMTDGQNGLMADIDDVGAITNAVNRIRFNPAFAQKLVQGGYNQIAEQFSRDRVVDQYLDLFSPGQETIHETFSSRKYET